MVNILKAFKYGIIGTLALSINYRGFYHFKAGFQSAIKVPFQNLLGII